MKRTRYSEAQIIKILKEAEAGRAAKEILREYGIAEGTFYRWKANCGGMDVNEAKRLRQLEAENRKLKQHVADLSLDNRALKDRLSRKW